MWPFWKIMCELHFINERINFTIDTSLTKFTQRVTLILWEPSKRISNHPAGVNAIWQPLLPFEITIHNGKCFVAMATVDHIRDCSWFVLVEDSTYVMFSVRLLIMSWPHFNLLDKCHRMGNEWTDFNAIRTVILFAFIVPEKCKTWINSFFFCGVM